MSERDTKGEAAENACRWATQVQKAEIWSAANEYYDIQIRDLNEDITRLRKLVQSLCSHHSGDCGDGRFCSKECAKP